MFSGIFLFLFIFIIFEYTYLHNLHIEVGIQTYPEHLQIELDWNGDSVYVDLLDSCTPWLSLFSFGLRRMISSTSPVFRSCQWQFSIMRWFQEQRTPYTIGEVLLHLIGLSCMIMVAVSFTQLESIILQEQRYASCCLPSACSYSFASVQQASQSLNILEGGICGPISRADALAMECEGELFGGHRGLVSTCIVNRRITSLKATTESEVEIEMQDICSRGPGPSGFWQAIFVAVWTRFVILTLALRFCCCIPGYFWLLLMGFGIATFVGIGFLVQLRSEKGYMEYEYKSSVGISCHGQWNEVNVIHLKWLEAANAAISSFDAWVLVLLFTTLGAMIFTTLNIFWLLRVRQKRGETSPEVFVTKVKVLPAVTTQVAHSNQTNEPSFWSYSAWFQAVVGWSFVGPPLVSPTQGFHLLRVTIECSEGKTSDMFHKGSGVQKIRVQVSEW